METLISHLQHALAEQIRQELPSIRIEFYKGDEIEVIGQESHNVVCICLRLAVGKLELRCYRVVNYHTNKLHTLHIPLADPECFTRVIECIRDTLGNALVERQ